MFCPSCGLENAGNNNYCKRCGAEMFEPEQPPRATKLNLATMFWAIGAFGFCGLALLLMGYLELARQGLRGDDLFLPFAMGFVFIGTIAGLLVWQLSRLITIQQQQLLAPRPIRRKRQELPAQPPQQQLPSVSSTDPIPLSSVVEGTTRQFAPVYREAQERE